MKLKTKVILKERDLNIILNYLTSNDAKGLVRYMTRRIIAKEKKKQKLDLRPVEVVAKEYRNNLINNQTPAEAKFKALLKANNIDYRFQEIFYYKERKYTRFYVLDFYIPHLNIAVEIDGGYHNEKVTKERDRQRTQTIKKNGISQVLRFTNKEVLSGEDIVKIRIVNYVKPKVYLSSDIILLEGNKYKVRKKKVYVPKGDD